MTNSEPRASKESSQWTLLALALCLFAVAYVVLTNKVETLNQKQQQLEETKLEIRQLSDPVSGSSSGWFSWDSVCQFFCTDYRKAGSKPAGSGVQATSTGSGADL